MTIAERLVRELMLVSVLVGGEEASSLAAELEAEGAAAETLAGTEAAEGFDLAILLAPRDAAGQAATREAVAALSRASERLLFAPTPLGPAPDGEAAAALPELTQWFEVFAEFGYQPVVEFDASFVSPGAFLVDRAAVADEGDLSAFADRLQLGPAARQAASSGVAAAPAADPGQEALRAELDAARAALAALRPALEASRAEALALEAGLRAAEQANAGWDRLRDWVRGAVADRARDTTAALARDLPRLNQLRGGEPFVLAELAPRRRFWQRRRAAVPPAILADTALVRASQLFDAAWYVASQPELAGGPPVDPVFHYVLVGGPRGADPGPWFETASYLADHPDCVAGTCCPLVHAIRHGEPPAPGGS
jgi:hypothetical protein